MDWLAAVGAAAGLTIKVWDAIDGKLLIAKRGEREKREASVPGREVYQYTYTRLSSPPSTFKY